MRPTIISLCARNDDLTTLSKQELIGRIVRLNEQLQEFRDMEEDYFNLQCSYEHLLEDHQVRIRRLSFILYIMRKKQIYFTRIRKDDL